MTEQRFTGERPGEGEGFEYDEARHLAAYEYASTLATGQRVLDAGCGHGFGTARLARVATSVLGIDHSSAAVETARTRWHHPNLRFEQADLAAPAPAGEAFDLVVSFQVVEHIADPRPFLRGLHARLRPGGTLVLTTPNRLTSFSENPFHVREYAPDDLRALLEEVFAVVTVQGIHGNAKVQAFDDRRRRAVRRILRFDPLGLRHVLPTWVTQRAFARLARLVRRQIGEGEAPAARITPPDFHVDATRVHDALDLLAICSRD